MPDNAQSSLVLNEVNFAAFLSTPDCSIIVDGEHNFRDGLGSVELVQKLIEFLPPAAC